MNLNYITFFIFQMYKYDILLLDLFRTAFKAGFKFGGFFTCIL